MQFLNVHAAKKPLGDDVDLDSLQELQPDLQVQTLKIFSMRRQSMLPSTDASLSKMKMSIMHLLKLVSVLKREARLFQKKRKKITAYHESGHAILFHVLPDVGPVHSVSIIPTGMGAAGYTMPLPEKDEMF